MADVVGPGGVEKRIEIQEILKSLDYADALEDVVRVAVTWHDTVVSGHFDDIPTKQNRVLSALAGFMAQWPEEYARLRDEVPARGQGAPEPAE